MTDDVIPVGNVPTDEADRLDISMATQQPIRIVHTSDTHMQHERLLVEAAAAGIGGLPDGDVLVHSGDFNRCTPNLCVRSLHYEDLLHEVGSKQRGTLWGLSLIHI